MPVELVQKCCAAIKLTRQTNRSGNLPQKIATRRNALATVMLPEAFAILRATTSGFRLRILLWLTALVVLGLSLLLTWWLGLLIGLIVIAERCVAAKERQFWMLLAAMLMSADMLVADFAGWGTAYPNARRAAADALGPEGITSLEWLDCYLPRRAELGIDILKAFGPQAFGLS